MPRRFSGPLLPGTKSVRTVNRRPRKVKTASLTRAVKKISLSLCETKRRSTYFENAPLTHNTTYYQSGFLATTQGVQNPSGHDVRTSSNGGERIGNEIIASGLSLKFFLTAQGNYPNNKYKLIVFKYPTRFLSGAVTALDDELLWQGVDGNGSVMNRMIDTISSRVKILKQVIIQPPAIGTTEAGHASSRSTIKNIYIPLKSTKIKYQQPVHTGDSSELPIGWDIGFALVGYDEFSTLTTATVAHVDWSSRLTFKDP